MIEKFAVGSLSTLGGSTNVDLDNKYIVIDISEMNEHLKALGMFIALDFVWDKAKESCIQKKVIFMDELWKLIGTAGNRLAADYVLEIFKVILQLEEDEAFTVQKHLSLSDEETMQIIRNNRGEALLCANRNKIVIDIKASPYIYNAITTKRSDLEKKRKRKMEEREQYDN